MKIKNIKNMYVIGVLAAILISLPTLAQETLFRQKKVININKILDNSNLSSQRKAELLVVEAEKMMNPTGFMLADKVLAMALRQDVTNKKAQFYKAFLRPAMELKGILKRVENLIEKEGPEKREKIYQYTRVKLPDSSLQAFLMDGTADINSDSDVQKFLDKMVEKFDEQRRFYKGTKGLKFDISLTVKQGVPELSDKSVDRAIWDTCYTKELESGIYEVSKCPYLKRKQVSMDQTDIEVLQQISAGLEITTVLTTAYDLQGALEFDRASRNGWTPTDKQIVDYFQSKSKFGDQRRGSLAIIHTLLTDIYGGAKWAYKLQSSLCPKGAGEDNRPGYLFGQGICIPSQQNGRPIEALFGVIDLALSNKSVDVHVENGNALVSDIDGGEGEVTYATEVNFLAPILKPVANLKPLMPTKFNECGNAVNVGDETLAGLFPNRDAQTFLEETGTIVQDCQ